MNTWGFYPMHFLYRFHFSLCSGNQFLKRAGPVLVPCEQPALAGQDCPHVPGHKELSWAFTTPLFFFLLVLMSYIFTGSAVPIPAF